MIFPICPFAPASLQFVIQLLDELFPDFFGIGRGRECRSADAACFQTDDANDGNDLPPNRRS